jgi:hypothetical protein
MKTIIVLLTTFIFSGNTLFAQTDHTEGGEYLKTIEYNVIAAGETEEHANYNLKHKSTIDRIFFGTENSFVEFVFEESSVGSDEAKAFRIIKNRQTDSYMLEVMRLQNLSSVNEKIRNVLLEKATPINVPYWLSRAVSTETEERIKAHNKQAAIIKQSGDLYTPYRPQPETFQISREFAEKLHGKTSILIDSFTGKGIPPGIFDGYNVTFRCVVEDELWTLSIHSPQEKALQLSGLFRRIIADGFDNKIDEPKYLQLLDEIFSDYTSKHLF